MKAHWDPTRLASSDDQVEGWYQRVVADGTTHVDVSSHLEFLRLRIGVKEGEIPHLTFVVDGEEYAVDENGRMPVWPDELDTLDRLLTRFIGL